MGGIFSMSTAARIRKAQEIAITQTRMKIPIIFGMDVIHGYRTMFPIPLGLSCKWNMELIERSARIAAIEASVDGINWTFSPMVDISRDPQWGRFSEGSGEDPYLGSQIAEAMIKGYQGDDLSKNNTLMSCVKHFALYGAGEAGRDYNTVDMSRVRMYNEYLPPYKAAVDAGVGTVMTSFNEVDGIPATANKWLMTDLLRRQWGFKELVVTDYTAINEMIDHGLGDLQEVSSLALKAGTDMDMVGEGFLTTLKQSLQQGKITIQQIDAACRTVLEAKHKLGLFDDPYRYCDEQRAATVIYSDAHRKEARVAATESFVLLKNDSKLLPLKKTGTVALIGPLADNRSNMPGTWSVSADFTKPVSLLEGFNSVVGDQVKILYAKGANLTNDSLLEERSTMFEKTLGRDSRSTETFLQEALTVANQSDVIIAALGEAAEMSGESSSRTDIGIPDVQKELLAALLKTGKPVVLVLFAGRPMTLTWEQQQVPAILNVWFPGSEAGTAVADVVFGDVNPSGKLSSTFPQNVGQIPLYYNHKNAGRPLADGAWFQKFRSNYLDVSNEPLFPFGFGLSYSQFKYGTIQLSKNSFKPGECITASVTVSNTSDVAGKEVVQLYIRDMVGTITRPVKELKGFQKIELQPGETKTVSFTISVEDLKFYNSELKYVAEPGDFKLYIGTNSRDVSEASFELA